MNEYPLFNLDSSLEPLQEFEVNAAIIEHRISGLSYKNLDFMDKRLPFVIECVTYNYNFWLLLAEASETIYLFQNNGEAIIVFPQTIDCGCIRTYRLRPLNGKSLLEAIEVKAKKLPNEEAMYHLLSSDANEYVFKEWIKHKDSVHELPTELISGRMQNTSVDRGMIVSKGDGCVSCGEKAECYAATTFGDTSKAFMLQLPVCRQHLKEARNHPGIFSFFATLFNLQLDWDEVEKLPYIQDELIPLLHLTVAEELNGSVGKYKKPTEDGKFG